ncbi:MAG: hypothetical protein WA906_08995, partial [Pacificimonas sp.]
MATQFEADDEQFEPVAAEESFRSSSVAAWDEDEELSSSRGTKLLWAGALLSVTWLAAAAALIWSMLDPAGGGPIALSEWASVAAGVTAPLAALWLILLVVARIDPGRGRETLARLEAAEARFAETSQRTAAELDGIDRILTSVGGRIDELAEKMRTDAAAFDAATSGAIERGAALSSAVAADSERLTIVMNDVAERADRTGLSMAAFSESLPANEGRVEAIGTRVDAIATAIDERMVELESRLSELAMRDTDLGERAMQRAAASRDLLTHIDQTARDVEAQMDERAAALDERVSTTLKTVGEALDHSRGAVAAQTDMLTGAIETARMSLDDAGRMAHETVTARLARLSGEIEQLDEGLARQRAGIDDLATHGETRFASLAETVAARTATLTTDSDGLAARLDDLSQRVETVAAPFGEIEAALERMTKLANETRTALGESIGLADEQVGAVVAERRAALVDLGDEMGRLQAAVAEADVAAKGLLV